MIRSLLCSVLLTFSASAQILVKPDITRVLFDGYHLYLAQANQTGVPFRYYGWSQDTESFLDVKIDNLFCMVLGDRPTLPQPIGCPHLWFLDINNSILVRSIDTNWMFKPIGMYHQLRLPLRYLPPGFSIYMQSVIVLPQGGWDVTDLLFVRAV